MKFKWSRINQSAWINNGVTLAMTVSNNKSVKIKKKEKKKERERERERERETVSKMKKWKLPFETAERSGGTVAKKLRVPQGYTKLLIIQWENISEEEFQTDNIQSWKPITKLVARLRHQWMKTHLNIHDVVIEETWTIAAFDWTFSLCLSVCVSICLFLVDITTDSIQGRPWPQPSGDSVLYPAVACLLYSSSSSHLC